MRSVCAAPSEAVQRGLLSGQTSQLEETEENRRLIGTDGLDYGNDHRGERGAFRSPRGAVLLAVLGPFSPLKKSCFKPRIWEASVRSVLK